jgi:hypothetical protein
MMMFFVLLTLGFVFELGKNALTIESRQTSSYNNEEKGTPLTYLGSSFHFFSTPLFTNNRLATYSGKML